MLVVLFYINNYCVFIDPAFLQNLVAKEQDVNKINNIESVIEVSDIHFQIVSRAGCADNRSE